MRKKKEIFEAFENVHDFYETISGRNANAQFAARFGETWKESAASSAGTLEFTGTESYDEAETLAKEGYAKGAANLAKVDASNFAGQTQKRRAVKADVVGFAPIVPNLLIGVPNAMLNSTLQPRKIPVVSLYYQISASYKVKAKDLESAARKVLAAVNAIERKNIRVELNVCECAETSHSKGQPITCIVKLKEYRQPLDLLKIAYPLTHPSFFRRHLFRWKETIPDLDESFKDVTFNYGKAIKDEKFAFENNLKGHVPENSVFLSFYQAQYLTAQQIAELISSRQH